MSLNHKQVFEDYYLIGIEQPHLNDPIALLSLSGVLLSESGRFKLVITIIEPEEPSLQAMPYHQCFRITAQILDKQIYSAREVKAFGSFSQAYNRLHHLFAAHIKAHGEQILLLTESEHK